MELLLVNGAVVVSGDRMQSVDETAAARNAARAAAARNATRAAAALR